MQSNFKPDSEKKVRLSLLDWSSTVSLFVLVCSLGNAYPVRAGNEPIYESMNKAYTPMLIAQADVPPNPLDKPQPGERPSYGQRPFRHPHPGRGGGKIRDRQDGTSDRSEMDQDGHPERQIPGNVGGPGDGPGPGGQEMDGPNGGGPGGRGGPGGPGGPLGSGGPGGLRGPGDMGRHGGEAGEPRLPKMRIDNYQTRNGKGKVIERLKVIRRTRSTDGPNVFSRKPIDFSILNLSDEQKQRIQQLHSENAPRARGIQKNLRTKRDELRDLLFSAATDDQILKKRKEVKQLQEKAEDMQINDFLSIRRVLTPEQRQRLSEAKPSGTRRMAGGPGGFDGGSPPPMGQDSDGRNRPDGRVPGRGMLGEGGGPQ